MLLLLVLGLVAIVFLAALNSSLRSTAKGVDGLTAKVNQFNRWLNDKAKKR